MLTAPADNPRYVYNLHAQRLSVYVQHKETAPQPQNDPDIGSTYYFRPDNPKDLDEKKGRYIPQVEMLDNGMHSISTLEVLMLT